MKPPPIGLSYRVHVVGVPREWLRDLYHLFLTARWPLVIGAIALVFLVVNAGFALAYHLTGGVANLPDGSLVHAFFFSVQTLATIGYGAMYPESLTAHWLVVVESVIGLLLTALTTGLVFAKFAQPRGRIVFSRHLVVTRHDGHPVLMLRVGNERGNRVVEAQIRADASITTTTLEGQTFYRLTELSLSRSRIPALARTFNVSHVLDARSPLVGLTPERAAQLELELLVTVSGLDDTSGQVTHGQVRYEAHQILFGHRFVDVLRDLPNGDMELDVRKVHQTVSE